MGRTRTFRPRKSRRGESRRVSTGSTTSASPATDVISDMSVVSADGGEPRRITDSTLTGAHPVFVDNERVVFLADSHPDLVGRDVQMFLASLGGPAAPRPLTDAEQWHLDGYGTG